MYLDVSRRAELTQGLEKKLNGQRKALRKFGYLPGGEGANKSLQAILKRMSDRNPGWHFPRTATGKFATARDDLHDLADGVPFIKLLLEHRTTEKLLGSFLNKMGKRVLHASFNVLARSGRTSSFGEINAQNLPRDDRVRSCFVASPGNVFLDLDYKTIELATLGQACSAQFGLDSKMAEAINAGKDLHRVVAARVTGKAEDKVTDDERKKAKPINFGKPGGMGNATLKDYAKNEYHVTLRDDEVRDLSDAWLDLFPEMKEFLKDNVDTAKELAQFLGLTPASHFEHTGDSRFVRHPENAGHEHRPHKYLGAMCPKAFKVESPQTRAGKPYTEADLDFFWSRLKARVDALDPKLRGDILRRRPSVKLQRAVMALVGRAPVFTLTGRLRANATYSARHNTVFQGLAADGAKLALWKLWRAGYRVVNFIHDQVLIEVPAGSGLRRHALRTRRLMIEGMRQVVPDVKVDVSYAATDRWHKGAEAVFSRSGKKLLLWHPEKKKEKTRGVTNQ